MSPFAEFLHTLRVAHNLRQKDLAAKVGADQGYVSQLERGHKGPPEPAFLERLCRAVPMTADECAQMEAALGASSRKLQLEREDRADLYWLIAELRAKLRSLEPSHVQLIRQVIAYEARPGPSTAREIPSLPRRRGISP